MINQIFKNKVDEKLFEKLLLIFNIHLQNIDNSIIIKTKLNDSHIEKFKLIETDLLKYYVNSKHKYFENINISKIIVILRQLLKLYNYIY